MDSLHCPSDQNLTWGAAPWMLPRLPQDPSTHHIHATSPTKQESGTRNNPSLKQPGLLLRARARPRESGPSETMVPMAPCLLPHWHHPGSPYPLPGSAARLSSHSRLQSGSDTHCPRNPEPRQPLLFSMVREFFKPKNTEGELPDQMPQY